MHLVPYRCKSMKKDILIPALFYEYYYDSYNINGKVANRKLLAELKRRVEVLS